MEEFPRIGLGTWKSPNSELLVSAVKYAVEEAGYRHIDCAKCYENEATVGLALKDLFERGVVKREELWVTSKLWNTDHRPEDVEAACRDTLAQLGLEYLDLYLMHYPVCFVKDGNELFPKDENGVAMVDPSVSIIDTWKAMEKLVELKLVRRIGVSNWSIGMLERLRYAEGVTIQPFTNQVEFHLYMQQAPMIQYLAQRGIVLTGYSTLGTADWKQEGEPTVLEDPVLNAVAKEVGKTPAEVELRFLQCLCETGVLLVKSVTPERIKANIHIDAQLSDEQVQRLKACERCYRFVDAKKNWKVDALGDGW